MIITSCLGPRLTSRRLGPEFLRRRMVASQVVVRAPTLLQLSDVKPRLQALQDAIPALSAADAAALASRCPSLLGYSR